MPLIHAAQLGDSARSAVVLDLGDIKRQGDRMIAAARAEADRIVAEARAERDRLLEGAAALGRAEGLERGRAEGLAAGAERGREEALGEHRERLAGLETAWRSALDEFTARRDEMLLEAGVDVLRLAASVAELVTRRAVRLDRGAAAAQLDAVLGLAARSTRLVVRVHPEDLRAFRSVLPSLAGRFGAAEEGGHVELAVDASLPRYSCVARTPGGGTIDASIGTQLERIAEALLPGSSRAGERGDAS